jgi:PAS domain S-box-containing protein
MNEKYQEAILENVPHYISIVDGNGKPKYLSSSFCNKLGLDQDFDNVLTLDEFFVSKSLDKFRAMMSDLLASPSKAIDVELKMLDGQGEEFHVRMHCTNKMADSRLSGLMITAFDVTEDNEVELERQKVQMKMLSQSKHATIGEVSTGVAHEVNQPLSYIKSSLQNLVRRLRKQDVATDVIIEKLDKSLNQVDRINKIIEHMRSFGRSHDVEVVNFDIPIVIDNALLLLSEKIRLRNITLNLDIDDGLPEVLGNINQLEQVLINLFQNSIDALEFYDGDKRISLSASYKEADRYLEFIFSDNGCGIPEALIEKVFEPFFTTKPVGKGTGIGLAVCYGILTEHNASFNVKSTLGEGTDFIIRFPVF